MRQRGEELTALGVHAVIVAFEAGAMARAYLEDTGSTWPLLVDAERTLYRAYGMDRASWWQVWGPRTIRAYATAIAAGGRLRWPRDDVRQRGGDVLVDPEGIIRLHRIAEGPADRPEIHALLDVVHRGTTP